jgi:hypothetical protein
MKYAFIHQDTSLQDSTLDDRSITDTMLLT